MNNKAMADKIGVLHPDVVLTPKFDNQIEVLVKPDEIQQILTTIKSLGFDHLSNITCVDWLKDNRMDVTYNVWSYKEKLRLIVKAGVNRQSPEISTIMALWPQAQVYEREIHEMFGVKFNGNPNLQPLFLHNWQDIPPLRKDFDTEKYSKLAYTLDELPTDTNKPENQNEGGE